MIVDPYFSGRYDFHHEERKDGFFLNAHGKPGDHRPVEYDFAKSPTLKVPGDWNTQRDSLYLYEGPVWYQRNFDYSAKPGHRVFLHIGAANSQISFQKPLIMSEFGGGAKAGLHGKEDDRWTEEYQANLYRHQLVMLNKIPQLRGMSPWVLMDFRSPYRLLPGIQDNFNRKGLVSDQGQKKAAFFVLQQAYEDKSIGHAGPADGK